MAFALAGSLLLAPSAPATVGADSSALRNAVTLAGIREHLAAFQAVAPANGGDRLAGTAGYDESADHVFDRLVAAGYSPVRQQFDFAFFQELAPPALERVSPDPAAFTEETDCLTQQYSGSGNVTADVVPTNDIVIPPARSRAHPTERFRAAPDGRDATSCPHARRDPDDEIGAARLP
jgi:hypothetical protein